MERMRCHIRPMTAADEGDVLLLAEEVLRPLAEGGGHPERYHTEELFDLVERAEVFVALTRPEGGQLAGFVAVEGNNARGLEVRCLCVAPAYEAQQVAHQLVDWVEGLAYERGMSRVSTAVPAADAASQQLYRGHGFATVPPPEQGESLLLEKRLAERP